MVRKFVLAFVALSVLVSLALALIVEPFVSASRPWAGPRADPARLEQTVRALAALGPRNDERGQARAAQFVAERVKALGYVPIVQHYRLTDEQLKATSRPKEPELTGEYLNVLVDFGQAPKLVIGAHFDARGPYPGADDNGSGVAALLELARMLKGRSLPIQLAFYSNEERGHVGSTHVPKDGVQRMISLEMLGCFGEPQKFPFPGMRFLYPDVSNQIVVVGRIQDFALARKVKAALRGSGAPAASIDAIEAIPGIGNSDHRSYWQAGIRAVMVTDTAWYRNPRYHTARDTPDTVDYARMAAITDGIAALASAH